MVKMMKLVVTNMIALPVVYIYIYISKFEKKNKASQ